MPIIKKPDYTIFASEAKNGEVTTFPNLLRGWGVTIDQTAGKPPMEWFNSLQNRTDEWLTYLSQRGISEWDSTLDYPKNAVVQSGGNFYVSITENKSKSPDKNQSDWKPMADVLNIKIEDGTLRNKGIVQLSSATDSDDEKKAATPKAVKAANDNASSRLKASENLSDLTDAAKAREALALDKVGNWPAVQANGGLHSSGNYHIYIDWGGDSKFHGTVDSTDVGEFFTTQNPPTPEQSNSYPKTGGRVDGEVWSEVGNNYRLVAGNRGVFWRFDGSSMYLMFTNDGDPHGGYNNLRPLIADFATGKLSTGHDFTAGGTLYAGAGACWMATDGNIYGSLWGGYLSNWIAGQISAALAGVVTGFRYASSTWVGTGSSDWAAPSGTSVTGVGIYTGAKARYSYGQICVGGQWYNVETVS